MTKIFYPFLIFLILAGCLQESKKKHVVSLINTGYSIKNYKKAGDSITMIIQSALLKKINSSIEEKGESYAVKFCNLNAIEITDSLSVKYQCLIRRVSMNNRNPSNEPFDEFEKKQLEKFILNKEEGKPIKDEIKQKKNTFFYFKPIFVATESCLKCHGERGKDIDLATEIKLYKYYPLDKATGYKVGDLRGMWSIKFFESKNQ